LVDIAAEVKSTEKIEETELKIKPADILNKSIRRIMVFVYDFANETQDLKISFKTYIMKYQKITFNVTLTCLAYYTY
jgi:uncharacterized membrane-anchored protein